MKSLTTEQIRECVIYGLEAFKQSWPKEAEFDYKVEEYCKNGSAEVKIDMGAHGKRIGVFRQYEYTRRGEQPDIRNCWERVLGDMMMGSVYGAYSTTVKLHRENRLFPFTFNSIAAGFPVSPEECLPTKSEMKEFMTNPNIKKPNELLKMDEIICQCLMPTGDNKYYCSSCGKATL